MVKENRAARIQGSFSKVKGSFSSMSVEQEEVGYDHFVSGIESLYVY